jgi:hypothetical protein
LVFSLPSGRSNQSCFTLLVSRFFPSEQASTPLGWFSPLLASQREEKKQPAQREGEGGQQGQVVLTSNNGVELVAFSPFLNSSLLKQATLPALGFSLKVVSRFLFHASCFTLRRECFLKKPVENPKGGRKSPPVENPSVFNGRKTKGKLFHASPGGRKPLGWFFKRRPARKNARQENYLLCFAFLKKHCSFLI